MNDWWEILLTQAWNCEREKGLRGGFWWVFDWHSRKNSDHRLWSRQRTLMVSRKQWKISEKVIRGNIRLPRYSWGRKKEKRRKSLSISWSPLRYVTVSHRWISEREEWEGRNVRKAHLITWGHLHLSWRLFERKRRVI